MRTRQTEIQHIEKDESIAIKYDKYAHKADLRSNRWSKRSGVAAKTAASAADHSLQGEQAALQSGMKALGYARSARKANSYAQEYASDSQRASQYAQQWSKESEYHRNVAASHARVAASHARHAGAARSDAESHARHAEDARKDAESIAAEAARRNAEAIAKSGWDNAWLGDQPNNWAADGFWGPQAAPRSHTEMPFWRNPRAYPPQYSRPQVYLDQQWSNPSTYPPQYSGPQAYSGTQVYAPYSNAYPYSPFGTAPYGYGLQGSAASPLKRAKELVDSVVVLMQHLTRSLEAAVPNCQLVNGYLAAYQRGMATYRAQGVGLGNLLSDEDMKLVEQYAEVQVQSFASDLEDAMANAESYCGLAGGVSLANGAPTVALGSVTTTHQNPFMSVPTQGVFQGAGGSFMGGYPPQEGATMQQPQTPMLNQQQQVQPMQQMQMQPQQMQPQQMQQQQMQQQQMQMQLQQGVPMPNPNNYMTNRYMTSPYAGMSQMQQMQQPATGARITPVAGISTPQFMGATPTQSQPMFKQTGPATEEQLAMSIGMQSARRRRV